MTEPAASALADVPRRSTSSASTCGPPRAARPRRSSRLLSGLVDTSPTRRARCPTVADGTRAGRARLAEAAALAVQYVSGMTDRFALGLGVELLGWRPEALPRGV